MKIEITDLDKEQKEALEKIGKLLAVLAAGLMKAAEIGSMNKEVVNAIRTTMEALDDVYDDLTDGNQDLFDFLQDGQPFNLKKV